ncbi:hypothetical protein GCM10027598_50700 [Amycolatopsis oliviviridis]|uniref:Uncharacterized protein n=1 Tax=Amycolatopsis oliviviridis TaxID=1471590 RepID=A0ABQ3MBR2_9PSEU|nr:hypothetical protein [Amycolatopsis oliviviridis]GHH31633.1 hypothetical protein GCM10017790_67190 [Amycolatopsis oliviviridis]
MAKPTPLQLRNIVMALLMAGALVWNLSISGAWWLTAIFSIGIVLSLFSAYLNRPGAQP